MELAIGGRERLADVYLVVDVRPSEPEHLLAPEPEPEGEMYRSVPGVYAYRRGEDPAAELGVDHFEVGPLAYGAMYERRVGGVPAYQPACLRTAQGL